VALTLVDGDSLGLDFGAGVGAHVRWGNFSWAVGSELRAAVLAGSDDGRTWIVRDDAEADRQLANIRIAAQWPQLAEGLRVPDPEVTFHERRTALEIDFQQGNRQAASLSVEDAYGERLDRAAGRRTVYVRDRAAVRGRVSFGRWSASGEGADGERIGITYDERGRPVDLMVLSTVDIEGAAGLPPQLARIAGYLRIPIEGSKHLETEQHLDLTDPLNAEIAQEYLTTLGDDRLAVRLVAKALSERLEQRGTLAVRTYATDATVHEVGGHLKAGPMGLGGEVGDEDEAARLTAAVVRRPDGTWSADPVCVPA
jgi:hypothetical protein